MMKRVLLAALSAAFLAGVSAAPSYAQATQQPASTTTQKPAAKTPRAKRAPTPGQLSARQRMRQCGAEWKAAKAKGETKGMKWPKFWSDCNKRLKAKST